MMVLGMVSIKKQVSCGGVVYRCHEDRCEVALILRPTRKGERIWCLPKGLMQEGESTEQTARREVREETGLEGKVREKLGEIQYVFYSLEERSKIQKAVHFFLMEYLQGSVEDHDAEVEEARWFSIKEAEERLVYENEREILRKAQQVIAC
jgi:8-oxo-dGTP pyrophosphatase MutT (NUDIX family)